LTPYAAIPLLAGGKASGLIWMFLSAGVFRPKGPAVGQTI
jgi:hypothetical protein